MLAVKRLEGESVLVGSVKLTRKNRGVVVSVVGQEDFYLAITPCYARGPYKLVIDAPAEITITRGETLPQQGDTDANE